MGLFEQPAIRHWLDTGWRSAEGTDHPLSPIAGERLGDLTATVLLGPSNRFGALYFQVYLADAQEKVGEPSLAAGLCRFGPYPAYNWVEIINLAQRVAFGASAEGEGQMLDVRTARLDQRLLERIASAIPPGGHLMLEYDSPEQVETARCLQLGIPPAATPLGHLLYSSGCGTGLKDWYFSEGGSEGPRKLQGHKPLNEGHAREGRHRLAEQLLVFLEQPSAGGHDDLEEPARRRAMQILGGVSVGDRGLQRRIRRALASRPKRPNAAGD
jgi:hypothetical protein